jgi:hypothetical protein
LVFVHDCTTDPNLSPWIVLTEKEPPAESWTAAKDRAEARRLWCGKEKSSFVAVKLDAKLAVDLSVTIPSHFSICPQWKYVSSFTLWHPVTIAAYSENRNPMRESDSSGRFQS